MKKELTPDQLKKRKKLNKRIILFFIVPVIILWIIIINIPSTPADKAVTPTVNIDSLINIVMKDTLYQVKDVYYNKKDSSFNIAFKYKKGDFYTTDYFNDAYHIDSFPCFDGIYLYAYKKGSLLKNGDYKNQLACESKRAGRIKAIFKEKYCYGNNCTPLIEYLKRSMNDPDSYESDKLWIEWYQDSSFTVTNSFRGKNAFNATILDKCSAIIDINGNVSDVKMDE